MSACYRAITLVLLVSLLVTGCGAVAPTATSVPATATRVIQGPTRSPLPPTPTPIPPTATITLTATPISPTATGLPVETPADGLIVFSSNQDGDWDIYTIDLEDDSLVQLTHNDTDDLSPSWSPDGAQIAFVSNRDGNDEIYIMSADGSDQTRLTETDASESFPAWSPDGTEISFDSDRDGNWEIYVMASDGGDVRRLTNDPADDWISSWSPDGSHIVFESKRDGNYEIYVMDAGGAEQGSGNQRRLTDNGAHDGFPAWSPDGAQIAFMSQRDGNYEIYVMNADGTDQRRVTDNRAEDSDPAWSPDGEWLTFISQRDGNDEIYVVRIDGTLERRLTTNASLEWGPAWQPIDTPSGRTNTWIRTLEGPDYGAFFDLVLTEDGNVLAVGATNHLHMPPYSGDAILMKLTLDGDVLWEQTWGGDGYEQAWSVAWAEDSGYYIFGETDSYGSGDRDFFLLKTTEDGSEDWFKTYGGSGREWPYGMLRLSNGDLLIYGFTELGADGDRDQYALRVGPDGEVIWEYTVAGRGEELVIDALETADGDLVLAVVAEEDGQLVKLDAGGNVLWTNRHELAGWQYASQIAETDDGGFLLAGFSMSSSPRRQADTWLARCTAAGELEWEKSFGDAAHDDYGTSLIRLGDGTYLIGGIGNGISLSRVDQDGNLLWRRSLVGESVYGSEGLTELEDGGYLVAGFIQIVNGRSYDAVLLRTDAEGWVGGNEPPAPRATAALSLGPGDTRTRPADGMTMVYVPAGQFEMGSDDDGVDYAMQLCSELSDDCQRRWYEDEQPVHTVALDGFWIDKYEVTNAQYQKCVEAGACQAPTTCNWGEPTYGEADKADHPAVCVDWQGAQDYCEWAGARLPTEAEWEYAARGPAGNVFPWGDTFDGTLANSCDTNCTLDWKHTGYDDGYEQTAPVGSYPDGTSWCGAEDMAGNVWEWVSDWYDSDYYSASPAENPGGPSSGEYRVSRGGSWRDGSNGELLLAAFRYYSGVPSNRTSNVGLRCASAIRSP